VESTAGSLAHLVDTRVFITWGAEVARGRNVSRNGNFPRTASGFSTEVVDASGKLGKITVHRRAQRSLSAMNLSGRNCVRFVRRACSPPQVSGYAGGLSVSRELSLLPSERPNDARTAASVLARKTVLVPDDEPRVRRIGCCCPHGYNHVTGAMVVWPYTIGGQTLK
jgi:hypothetical protein